MGYRHKAGWIWICVMAFSLSGCGSPAPISAPTLTVIPATRAATLTPEATLTATPTPLPVVIPLNLPAESDLEAAFNRDWAPLIARLEAAPQGEPQIPVGGKVVLVPRTARLAYIQSQLWPEMVAGAGGADRLYLSYDYTRGQVLGHRLNYSLSVSTETLEIITSLELYVERDGQFRQIAALETTGGEGATSLADLVRNAVPAQDWLSTEARTVEAQLETAIGYACGILLQPDLDYERQVALLSFALAAPDWAGRRQAAEALGDLRPIAVASATLLVEQLKDSDYNVAHAAEKALEAMLADPRVYELAVAGLEDPDAAVRRSSLRMLGRLPERPAELLDTVMTLFHDENSLVRSEAEYWLWPCEPLEIVDLMKAELAGSDDELRGAAIQVLGGCEEMAQSAVPALLDLLEDPNPELRWRAASALHSIGDRSQPVMDALIRAAGVETDPEAFAGEVSAVKYLGSEAAAFRLLEAALANPLARLRHAACDSLIDYTDVPGALDLMVSALDDPDSDVRIAAAIGLIYFDKEDTLPVVPKLIAMLADPDPSVSYQVSYALQEITGQTLGEDAAAWNAWWEQNKP
jgi:HEAT repeat protein